MRICISFCTLAVLAAFTACGPQPPKPEAKPATAKVSNAAGKAETKFVIEANDRMRFSESLIEVPAGKKITIVFNNVGHMPKEQMGHNLVILKDDKDAQKFAMEATYSKDNGYIPKEMEDWIVAHTELLGPGQSETLVFNAPKKPGEYPFICTFPAHYAIGMKGIMRVVVEVDQ